MDTFGSQLFSITFDIFLISDTYEKLYPYVHFLKESASTHLLPAEKLIDVFSGKVPALSKDGFVSAPPVGSITTEDSLRRLNTDQVILKIDVEGAECKVSLIKIFL